jgi:hypothetical protein
VLSRLMLDTDQVRLGNAGLDAGLDNVLRRVMRDTSAN